MNPFLEVLKQNGWLVQTTRKARPFPDAITRRYRMIPANVGEILSDLNRCVSPDDSAWLICIDDYHGTSDSAFKWNEFELLSLEAAGEDQEWKDRISNFWDDHFPVFMSVANGYEYAAVRVANPGIGTVVKGCEPDFEETIEVASNFGEFLRQLAEA